MLCRSLLCGMKLYFLTELDIVRDVDMLECNVKLFTVDVSNLGLYESTLLTIRPL